MQIGFVTFFSDDVVRFAADAGFDTLECFAERGSSLDVTVPRETECRKMEEAGLRFSALSCSPNHLDGDESVRVANNAYFLEVIRRCRDFGCDVVTTGAGSDPSSDMQTNLERYRRTFSVYAEEAEKRGVCVAIENCPHFTGYPYRLGNIGYSPELLDELFRLVDSSRIGLEYDPSHLFWQNFDLPEILRRYASRLYGFHAKDCEILPAVLAKTGILGLQLGKSDAYDMGWWRYRIPGHGQIDWRTLLDTLQQTGYTRSITIEHEDSVLGAERSEGNTSLSVTERGLRVGLSFLRKFEE